MADVFANRIRETTTTTGTGTLSLAGAAIGHKAFSTLAVGSTCTYCLEDADSIHWEIGRGTVGSGTLARTTVYEGTSGTSPITLTAGTHQVYLTLTSDLFEHAVVTPEQFGAVGDGVTDDTAAIQAAIDFFPGGNGSVFLPRASYKTVATLNIAQNGIEIRGSGLHSTTILYTPITSASCFKFSHGASVLYACQIRDMAIYSADITYTKTAVEIIDASGFIADNLSISGVTGGPGYWNGGTGSIGIKIAGREDARFLKLVITADRPLVCGTNPNNAISLDHHHFQDLYLTANNNPCVEFLTGVNVSNVTFDSTQAWVDGTYGFYWNDTTSSIASYQLALRGIRQEGSQDANSYQIYIAHNTNLQGLHVSDFYGTGDNNHCYLRNVLTASFDNDIYVSSSKIAMNAIGVAGSTLSFRSCAYHAGSTATLTNFIEQFSTGVQGGTTAPIPETSYYVYNASQPFPKVGGVKTMKFTGTLTSGASTDLKTGPGYGFTMSLMTVAAHGATKDEGGVVLNGGGTAFKIAGTTNFAVTNVASNLCVTNDGVFVSILNNLGETVTYVADVSLG